MSKTPKQMQKEHEIFMQHLTDLTPQEIINYYLAAKTGADFNQIPDIVPLAIWSDAIDAIETMIESLENEEE